MSMAYVSVTSKIKSKDLAYSSQNISNFKEVI